MGDEMINKGDEMKRPMKMHMALLPFFPMAPIYLVYFLQPKPIITLSTNKSIYQQTGPSSFSYFHICIQYNI